jgi:hypothetical protein
MRIIAFALLALVAGSAAAAAQGTCTFTYNTVSRKVEMRCTGIPSAPLGVNERALLATGRVKACVVEAERVGDTQLRLASPVCK